MTRPREGPDARSMSPSEAAAKKIADNTIEILRAERDRLFNTVEQQAAEIERLRAEMDNYGDDFVCQMKSKDARIDELEADNQNLVNLNKSLMNNDWILRDNNRKYRKRAQKAELLNKELKSKIGPDARPKCDHAWQAAIEERGYQTCLKCGECRNIEDIPRTAPAWQITEERREALEQASHICREVTAFDTAKVLQAMLKETDHDKP